MMLQLILMSCGSVIILLAAGYLLGARRGSKARDALRLEVERLSGESQKLGSTLERERGSNLALMARMTETEQRQQSAFQELMAPILERERFEQGLSSVGAEVSSRGELPRFLEMIAQRGNFTAMLLTDEVGLPLAATQEAQGAELMAATAALLLAFVDRIATNGSSPPVAAVFRDETDHLMLHRIFRVGPDRFVLTAVTRSNIASPAMLDPVLARIERLLSS